jgi:parvulin-like peptidyl-prolyl isomerase
MDAAPLPMIARAFGPEFAADLNAAEAGKWTGPVASVFGLHLVLVTSETAGRIPELAQVRDVVLREWANAQRLRLEAENFAAMLQKYSVSVEWPVAEGQGS